MSLHRSDYRLISQSLPRSEPRQSGVIWLICALRRMVAPLGRWQPTRRKHREISTLDEHLLKDIGLTRGDLQRISHLGKLESRDPAATTRPVGR